MPQHLTAANVVNPLLMQYIFFSYSDVRCTPLMASGGHCSKRIPLGVLSSGLITWLLCLCFQVLQIIGLRGITGMKLLSQPKEHSSAANAIKMSE